jgi:hypothetical protein
MKHRALQLLVIAAFIGLAAGAAPLVLSFLLRLLIALFFVLFIGLLTLPEGPRL